MVSRRVFDEPNRKEISVQGARPLRHVQGGLWKRKLPGQLTFITESDAREAHNVVQESIMYKEKSLDPYDDEINNKLHECHIIKMANIPDILL